MITGIPASDAILASAAARARSSGIGISPTILEQTALMVNQQHCGIVNINHRTSTVKVSGSRHSIHLNQLDLAKAAAVKIAYSFCDLRFVIHDKRAIAHNRLL